MNSRRAGVGVGDDICTVGGHDKSSALSGAEKYNQDEDRWTHVRSMSTARCDAGVCMINDKIYVVGGYDGRGVVYKCAECYNVKTDSWSRVRDMNVGRWGAAVVVGNDCLYVVGGMGEGRSRLSSIEVYNTRNNTWTLFPSSSKMSSGRFFMGAVMIDTSTLN